MAKARIPSSVCHTVKPYHARLPISILHHVLRTVAISIICPIFYLCPFIPLVQITSPLSLYMSGLAFLSISFQHHYPQTGSNDDTRIQEMKGENGSFHNSLLLHVVITLAVTECKFPCNIFNNFKVLFVYFRRAPIRYQS